MTRHLGRLLALLSLPLGMSPAAGGIVSVPGAATTIQAAIDGASPGDLVLVQPGYYHERIVLRDSVSLQAAVAGAVFVDAESEGSAVTAIRIGAATTVAGFVFQHGSAYAGGGLHAVAADLTFSNCTFTANAAVLGGGVHLRDGSKALFTACTFSNNAANVGGGLYLDFSRITVGGSFITANVATDGGALSANNASEATVAYTCIYGNRSTLGSTIACNLASPSFTNCTVAANAPSVSSFSLRGSGTRIERCIVAFSTGTAIACSGLSSPWVGCNIVFGNGADTICGGDQGTNLFLDPLFCDLAQSDFELSANSPAAGGSCGGIGAHSVACPARGVETAVTALPWSDLKLLYRP